MRKNRDIKCRCEIERDGIIFEKAYIVEKHAFNF